MKKTTKKTQAPPQSDGTEFGFYAMCYGIPSATIVWYHSGNCYSQIVVNTIEAAKAVHEIAKKDTANGGWMHGMPLGIISAVQQPNGGTHYAVTC